MRAPTFEIESGTCFVLFAFDVAQGIDLDEAARLIRQHTERETIPHQRSAPPYFQYRPPPLRLTEPIVRLRVPRIDPHRTFERRLGGREIVVRAHPELVQYLENEGREALQRLSAALGVKVAVQTVGGHPHREDYEVHVR